MASPRFTVITPVFDPVIDDFRACADSVLGQSLPDWEWVIADDASQSTAVGAVLAELARHPQVFVHRLASNSGIAAATNRAIEAARGEFLVFLDHDDELTLDALSTVSQAIDDVPEVDFLYSDEAKIGPDGRLYDWFAKPEWSPERLRGQNYCNHLSVYRTKLVRSLGGLRDGFDGAQDHDLLLRASELTSSIVHIPQVLYHWRATTNSTAADPSAKPAASTAGCLAVQEHLARRGIDATVTSSWPGRYTSTRRLGDRPMVSIVIPTRGDTQEVWGRRFNLVENAVNSIVSASTYDRVEVVIVYDSATSDATIENLRRLVGSNLVLVPWEEPFNFSRKMNLGVTRSCGDVIVLLNDDTQIITPSWIEILLGLLQEPDVGMVGPMLLLADGRLQSAGHHYAPSPLHLGAGAPADDPGPHAMFTVAGERSGVTAACAAIRRDVYFEIGGLSERFPACYNDVDLGFKLLEAGYRVVWTPDARLYHFESLTRDPRETPAEAAELERRWGRRLGDDPFARQIDLWWANAEFIPPRSTR